MDKPAGVRAVAFDVDGVLVDIRFPVVLPRALGIDADEALAFFDGPFQECLLGTVELRDVLPPYLQQWRWPGSYDSFIEFWFQEEAHINQPVLRTARLLRDSGMTCLLASTQERQRARFLESLLQVGRVFERAYFSCDLGFRKPDPEFYRRVTRDLALPPSAIFLLDDQAANVHGARAAGWRAELYSAETDLDAVIYSCSAGNGALSP